MTELKIEYVPIDQIVGAEKNPKQHQTELVEKSITRFGYVAPAIRDERTGRLVVGHGRTKALLNLRDTGQTPPSGIHQDEHGTWLIPVVHGWSSHSDEEASAYLIADNHHTELGGWNLDELSQLLDDIGDQDLINLTGWDLDELGRLLTQDEETPEDETSEDEPLTQTWILTVTCQNEQEQLDLYQRLHSDGYQVKTLT